jgi:UDP-N-acetylglucosamine--N-acetylmuramyl-(pentapeptide) pyrophosphoryl-undecaprenol N-acetylglucosamine transferase
VPYSFAAANHQAHNAAALAAAGAASDLPEREVTPERLWSELASLVAEDTRRVAMAERARQRAHPHAARAIAERLVTLLEAA